MIIFVFVNNIFPVRIAADFSKKNPNFFDYLKKKFHSKKILGITLHVSKHLCPCYVQKSFVLGSLINMNGISRRVWYPFRRSKCHFQKAVFSVIMGQRWYSLLRDDATAPVGTARSPVNEKALILFLQMSTLSISRLR